jgi:hypothetical protein
MVLDLPQPPLLQRYRSHDTGSFIKARGKLPVLPRWCRHPRASSSHERYGAYRGADVHFIVTWKLQAELAVMNAPTSTLS